MAVYRRGSSSLSWRVLLVSSFIAFAMSMASSNGAPSGHPQQSSAGKPSPFYHTLTWVVVLRYTDPYTWAGVTTMLSLNHTRSP